jgi:hypothetical protein
MKTLEVCRRIPSSARERAIFSTGKDGEAGDVCSIVDGAGCSQVEKGPFEARATFLTEPCRRDDNSRKENCDFLYPKFGCVSSIKAAKEISP